MENIGQTLAGMRVEPRFTQYEVLQVTGLKASTLQTWVNRGLVGQNTASVGTGNRRLYSAIDVVRIALMSEVMAYGIGPTMARDLAVWFTSLLVSGREVKENLTIVINRQSAGAENYHIVASAGFAEINTGEFSDGLGRKNGLSCEHFYADLDFPLKHILGDTAITRTWRFHYKSGLVVRAGEIFSEVFRALDRITASEKAENEEPGSEDGEQD